MTSTMTASDMETFVKNLFKKEDYKSLTIRKIREKYQEEINLEEMNQEDKTLLKKIVDTVYIEKEKEETEKKAIFNAESDELTSDEEDMKSNKKSIKKKIQKDSPKSVGEKNKYSSNNRNKKNNSNKKNKNNTENIRKNNDFNSETDKEINSNYSSDDSDYSQNLKEKKQNKKIKIFYEKKKSKRIAKSLNKRKFYSSSEEEDGNIPDREKNSGNILDIKNKNGASSNLSESDSNLTENETSIKSINDKNLLKSESKVSFTNKQNINNSKDLTYPFNKKLKLELERVSVKKNKEQVTIRERKNSEVSSIDKELDISLVVRSDLQDLKNEDSVDINNPVMVQIKESNSLGEEMDLNGVLAKKGYNNLESEKISLKEAMDSNVEVLAKEGYNNLESEKILLKEEMDSNVEVLAEEGYNNLKSEKISLKVSDIDKIDRSDIEVEDNNQLSGYKCSDEIQDNEKLEKTGDDEKLKKTEVKKVIKKAEEKVSENKFGSSKKNSKHSSPNSSLKYDKKNNVPLNNGSSKTAERKKGSKKIEDNNNSNSDDDVDVEVKKSSKKKIKAKSSTSEDKSKQLKYFEKVARACGVMPVGKSYTKTFEGCIDEKEKMDKVKQLLRSAGMTGRISMEEAEVIKLRREAAELCSDNIISNSGRGQRNIRSTFNKNTNNVTNPPSDDDDGPVLTSFKSHFSNLKDIFDSENSD